MVGGVAGHPIQQVLARVDVYDRGSAVSAFTNIRVFVLSGRDDTGAEVFGTNEAYQP